MSKIELGDLSKEEKVALLTALEEKNDRVRFNKYLTYFADTGKYGREHYTKHTLFFAKGSKFKERAFIAGNRAGKTTCGLLEMMYHLSGLYPTWWEGKRFGFAIKAIASGKTNQTTRDIIQEGLLGSLIDVGTGMIPKDLIVKITPRQGVAGAILDIYVKHTSGGTSHLVLKSYEQGRGAFEGISAHVVWFDEEPPLDVYSEALVRTATTEGIVYLTFTPLDGITDVITSFSKDGGVPEDGDVNTYKTVVMVSSEDVPHHVDTDSIKANSLPHEVEARIHGRVSIGAGKIYPVAESDFVVEPFKISTAWAKAFGMDVGWNKTAVVWGAIDPNTDTLYIYDEYYRGQAEPSAHVSAIKARGDWIRGAIDYAGGAMVDGQRLTTTQQYYQLGLMVQPANKAVDAGLLMVYRYLCDGKLKVFRNCVNWLKEYRTYRRSDDGRIVKINDHLMDATRYLAMTGINCATIQDDDDFNLVTTQLNSTDPSSITGY